MPASMNSREFLARLVAFDTVSSRSNLALIEFVREYLAGFGVESQLIANDAGDKANLLARIGPERAGGVVLSGHSDVVPVEGQSWSSDPFRLESREDRLYGRGTSDMKGFIACVLAAVGEMVEAPLTAPLHLSLTYDEEVGCLGAPRLIARMQQLGLRPEAVIVGEPTRMQVVDAHKGVVVCRTEVTGRPAHSSQPHRGVSAVMLAARLVHWLSETADDRLRRSGEHPRFEPPWSTLTVNRIRGGTAHNILAGHCEFVWDLRHLPDEDVDGLLETYGTVCAELQEKVAAVAPAATIVNSVHHRVPPLSPEPDGPALALAAGLAGGGRPQAVSYGTEGGQFQGAGFSTVICGPGSIDQAHQPDEYIDAAELDRCDDFLRRLIRRQCGDA